MFKLLVSSVAFIAITVVTVVACDGSSSPPPSVEPEATAARTPSLTPTPSLVATPPPPPIFGGGTPLPPGCPVFGLIDDLRFDGGRSKFVAGEPISITVTFTNCGNNEVRLFFSDSQRYDFVVEDTQDRVVWHWSQGRVFTEAEGEETIDPGDSVVYTEVWDQRNDDGNQVEPGRYQIFGFSIGCAEEGAIARGCQFGPGLFIQITP